MADDKAVKYSAGFLEGWIDKAAEMGNISNGEAARTHLKIMEMAYDEYRLAVLAYRKIIREAQEKLNAAPTL